MAPGAPTTFVDAAGTDQALHGLVDRALRLEQIQQHIRAQLPPAMVSQVQVINLRGDQLLIRAGTPPAQMQVRRIQNRLLEVLTRAFPELQRLHVELGPLIPEPDARVLATAPLPPAAQECLQEVEGLMPRPPHSPTVQTIELPSTQTQPG